MDVHVLGIIMNKKIIITLLVACLMQACTKNETTEKASSSTTQTEAVKANTSDSQKFIDQGESDIATYGKETLQYLLDQKHPDLYTAFTVDNVRFLRQQSEDLFLYTWNIRFLDNQSDDVYGCDNQQLSWNKRTSDIESTLNDVCFNIIEKATQPETAEVPTNYKFSYRIESETARFGNQSTILYTMVIASESDSPVKLNTISVNRGGCPAHAVPAQNNVLQFGGTYKIRLHCDASDVKEVRLSVDNDIEYIMKPQY